MASQRIDGPPHAHVSAKAGDKGLKENAVGFLDALIIGISSTAPAYSLAAVIGTIAVFVGVQSPGVMLFSFVPMFLIAAAFYHMNRADPDCGTSFSWITRAMGPRIGWVAGWAVCTTGILVIGSLADIAALYTFELIGLDSLRDSKVAVTVLAVVYIAAMTTACVVGTEPTARLSRVLVSIQVGALLLFGIVTLLKVVGGDGGAASIDPSFSWFNPFEPSFDALVLGLLTGVFIYWGWESAVNLNEESENSDSAPGRAALVSTVLLLLTYVLVAMAVVSWAGPDGVAGFDDDPAILGDVANDALGSPFYELVLIAIITSGVASTQTTILPASRTILSMARQGAMPESLGNVHGRFRTPHVSTILVGATAALWYVVFNFASQNFLFDSLTALAIVIAFYYSLTGFACAIYYRRELTRSVANFLFIGVAPVVGGLILAALFFKGVYEFSKVDDSYTAQSAFGVALPAVIGVGLLLIGIVLMLIWNARGNKGYFGRMREMVDPDVAGGRKAGVAAVPE